jgi:hypothetical protein
VADDSSKLGAAAVGTDKLHAGLEVYSFSLFIINMFHRSRSYNSVIGYMLILLKKVYTHCKVKLLHAMVLIWSTSFFVIGSSVIHCLAKFIVHTNLSLS